MHLQQFPFLEGLAAKVLFLIGTVFWILALLQMIQAGRRDKTSAMPFLAICSNVTYQLYFGFICPSLNCSLCPYGACAPPGVSYWQAMGLVWAWGIWLALQLVILWQLVRWGKNQPQEFILPEKWFYPALLTFLVLFYLYQSQYSTFYSDFEGNVVTYESNLMMSVLFNFLLFARGDLRGLSSGAAWSKMLGTSLQAASILLIPGKALKGHSNFGLVVVIFGATFFFDVLYIGLLAARRREKAAVG